MKRWEEQGWQKEDLDKLALSFLNQILQCSSGEAVDGTVAFAAFLQKIGVTPDTYPIYLRLLDIKNHWVVDALVGDSDPDSFFGNIQVNYYIVRECFRAFASAQRGAIYPKSLLVYLGVLSRTYQNPLEGYRIYPLTETDVNNLGKHLNENQDQMSDQNKPILFILDKIASLIDPGNIVVDDQKTLKVATQANNIRGKFLDMTKHLNEAIPDLLLEIGNYAENEISTNKYQLK